MKLVEEALPNGRLRRAIAQVVGRSGSLRFRLARDTLGVMAIKALSMGLGFVVSVMLAGFGKGKEDGFHVLKPI